MVLRMAGQEVRGESRVSPEERRRDRVCRAPARAAFQSVHLADAVDAVDLGERKRRDNLLMQTLARKSVAGTRAAA
jgi:hypothetical protein